MSYMFGPLIQLQRFLNVDIILAVEQTEKILWWVIEAMSQMSHLSIQCRSHNLAIIRCDWTMRITRYYVQLDIKILFYIHVRMADVPFNLPQSEVLCRQGLYNALPFIVTYTFIINADRYWITGTGIGTPRTCEANCEVFHTSVDVFAI